MNSNDLRKTALCQEAKKFSGIKKETTPEAVKNTAWTEVSAMLTLQLIKGDIEEKQLRSKAESARAGSEKNMFKEEKDCTQVIKGVSRLYNEYKPLVENVENKVIIRPTLTIKNGDFPLLDAVLPQLNGEDFVDSNCVDFIIVTKDSIEGVKIKYNANGNRFFTTSGNHRIGYEPEQYLIMQALRNLIPEGEKMSVTYTLAYLVNKNVDKGPAAKWSDKYQASVSITEVYMNHPEAKLIKSPYDKFMLNEVALRVNGKHACTEDDCKFCSNKEICKFVPVPEKLEVKGSKKKSDFKPNESQQAVLDSKVGAILVIAGAGSGKTATGVNWCFLRAKELMEQYDLSIDDALRKVPMITFTDAAAKEMSERLIALCNDEGYFPSEESVQAFTFNAWAFEIDKKYYQELGYAKPLQVIDEIKRGRYINDILSDNPITGLNYDSFTTSNKYCHGALVMVKKCFDIIKANNIDPNSMKASNELYDKLSEIGWTTAASDITASACADILAAYTSYDKFLKEEGLMEFADQEPAALSILETHPECITTMGYEYCLLDELQDTSPIQMQFIELLCTDLSGALAVGDDFQSIYQFRGANSENILNFEKEISKICKCSTVFMVENYRSYANILKLADSFIKANTRQMAKELVAARGEGGVVEVEGFYDKESEVNYTVSTIKRLNEEGRALSDIGIIVYRNDDCDLYAKALGEAGIRCTLKNPQPYLSNSRVQAALNLAKAFYDPQTANLKSYIAARYNGKALEMFSSEEINAEIESIRSDFVAMDNRNLGFQRILFHEYLNLIDVNDEIYHKFLELCYAQPDLPSELEYMDDFDFFGKEEKVRMLDAYEGVTLITAHSSKGLEYPVVFASLDNFWTFKCEKKPEADDNGDVFNPVLEEMRRLGYVVLTRAMEELYVTGTYIAYTSNGATIQPHYNGILKELFDIYGKAWIPEDPEEDKKTVAKAMEKEKQKKLKAMEKAEYVQANAEYIAKLDAIETKSCEQFDINELLGIA